VGFRRRPRAGNSGATFYLELFRALEEHRVRYLLVGGLAMNLHGVPRMTMDVDLVLALDAKNIDQFMRCAQSLGLEPQVPVPVRALADPIARTRWIQQRHMIAFALSAPEPSAPTVDVLIAHPLDVDVASARAVVRDADGVAVRMASIEDMIALKSDTGRRQDADDVVHLRRLQDVDGDGC
jgi:hypothetical protein